MCVKRKGCKAAEATIFHSKEARLHDAPALRSYGRRKARPLSERQEHLLRDVLPGRYAFGLTGRGPNGGMLSEGSYVLRLRAYPVDGDDGTRPSTAEAVFTITR